MNKSENIHRVVKYRLDESGLSEEQVVLLNRSSGTMRVAYNWALKLHNDREDNLYRWMLDQIMFDLSVDEDRAKELVKNKDLKQKLRKLAPKELVKISSVFELVRLFREESEKEDCYFHWYTAEKHGVNKPYVVHSAMEAFHNALDRYFKDINGCRTNGKGKKPRKDGKPHGWPRFIRKGDGRDGFIIQSLARSDKGKSWEEHKPKCWKVVSDAHHIKIPSFGNLRVCENTKQLRRMVDRGGWPKSARFSKAGGYWYVSIVVHFQSNIPENHTISPTGAVVSTTPTKKQRSFGTIGVDLGVKDLATLSTGQSVPNLKFNKSVAKKIRRLQRKLDRQKSTRGQEPSNNYRRTKAQLAKLQHKTALKRQSYVHRITKGLSTHAETVAIEDLNVKGMTGSPRAKPDPDREGQYLANGKAAKSGLNKAILDIGFGEFRRQLQYKTPMYGSNLVAVARFAPTSKMCSNCGEVKESLKLSQRIYKCDNCGFKLDRDHNAAVNIKRLANEMKNE